MNKHATTYWTEHLNFSDRFKPRHPLALASTSTSPKPYFHECGPRIVRPLLELGPDQFAKRLDKADKKARKRVDI